MNRTKGVSPPFSFLVISCLIVTGTLGAFSCSSNSGITEIYVADCPRTTIVLTIVAPLDEQGMPVMTQSVIMVAAGVLPPGHIDVGNRPCSTCHLGGASNAAPNMPPEHVYIGNRPCTTCHPEGAPTRGGEISDLPSGHLSIGDRPCTVCHPEGAPKGETGLPLGHINIGNRPCTACHPGGAPNTETGLPAGHINIGNRPCTACHPEGSPNQGGESSRLPSGHPSIGNRLCTACHAGAPPTQEVQRPVHRPPPPTGNRLCTACHAGGAPNREGQRSVYRLATGQSAIHLAPGATRTKTMTRGIEIQV